MPLAYRMPVRTELSKRVGPKLFRKTILRAGHIEKNGIVLDVDRPYLEGLVANFTAGTMDAVPFQLADRLNRHSADPTRTRGYLAGLELTGDDELVGLFEMGDDGARLLDANPRLGASVSIDPVFERADGRKCGPTLVHVAGTIDPEVSKLGDWVALSSSYDQVIDLTASPEASHEGGQPPHPKETTVPPQLTDEELAQIRALAPLLTKLAAPEAGQAEDKPGDAPEFTDAELDAMAAGLDDENTDDENTGDDQAEDDAERVAASAGHDEALDLANARIDAQQVELSRLRTERDTERYAAERDDLQRNFGIPADVTELARPLLLGAGHTIQLSAGKTVDAGQIVRKVLHELGRRYAKALDLGAEFGTADATDDQQARQRELDEFVARAHTEMRTRQGS